MFIFIINTTLVLYMYPVIFWSNLSSFYKLAAAFFTKTDEISVDGKKSPLDINVTHLVGVTFKLLFGKVHVIKAGI